MLFFLLVWKGLIKTCCEAEVSLYVVSTTFDHLGGLITYAAWQHPVTSEDSAHCQQIKQDKWMVKVVCVST